MHPHKKGNRKRNLQVCLCFENHMLRIAALLLSCVAAARGQAPIPPSLDSIGWEVGMRGSPMRIEIFGDFQCPDTKAAWTGWLKTFRQKYAANISIVFHPFPLPYHKNGFDAAQAAVVMTNRSLGGTTFVEASAALFAAQDSFQTDATIDKSQRQLFTEILAPVAASVGLPTKNFLQHMTNEDPANEQVRGAWKFGAQLGVSGTPSFAANGVVSDELATWTLAQWEAWAFPSKRVPRV